MQYYKAPDNTIHSLDSAEFEALLPAGSIAITDVEAEAILAELSRPTQAQLIEQFENAIQQRLDAYAQSWGYDSLLSAATYTASSIPKFRNEALTLVGWRDGVWLSAAAKLQDIQEGGPMPESIEAFIATLPAEPTRP